MIDADYSALLGAVEGRFGSPRMIVIGDVMLDRQIVGHVRRISPEAPVPVLLAERSEETGGGAANVCRNLSRLGAKVSLSSVVGEDQDGARLKEMLGAEGLDLAGVVSSRKRPTTVKTRLIGSHQQMLRIDNERVDRLSDEESGPLIASCESGIASGLYKGVILSDYDKGVLTREVCQSAIKAARSAAIPVFVDPKGNDPLKYAGATAMTPNRGEFEAIKAALGVTERDEERAAIEVAGRLGLEFLVLTKSEDGMAVYGRGAPVRVPAMALEVFDVTGAGDTAIAVLALAFAAGFGLADTLLLANVACGIVVGKVGTKPVERRELEKALSSASGGMGSKLWEPEDARTRVEAWRGAGDRIVFTNGCFDILHAGHVSYLERARRRGQRLVVGLNSDASVRRLKGGSRPINPEGDRAMVLSALACVDAVVIFDEDTPLRLIESLRPDVLAKGADYSVEQIVGAKEVLSWGGEVARLELLEGRSTTAIAKRAGRD